jgi:hypothetical protein
LEAAEPDKETVTPGVGAASYPVKGHRYEDIKAHIEDDFAEEIEKTATLTALSPELGERGRAVLETRKAACLARLDEVFADHMVAEEAWQETCNADEDALMAICAHRCASMEELATKVRYLAGLDSQLEPDQSKTFFADGSRPQP